MNDVIKETSPTINSVAEINSEIQKQENYTDSVPLLRQPKSNIEPDENLVKAKALVNELYAAVNELNRAYLKYRSNMSKRSLDNVD